MRLPLLLALVLLALWEAGVRLGQVPPYILPAPSLIGVTLWRERASLAASWVVTMEVTLLALALATLFGVVLAVLMAQSRLLERALLPYAVVLQVTPIIAVAPLIIIWIDEPLAALVVCALLVAFFPIVANTAQGLKSADPALADLFRLYGAGRVQRLRLLEGPTALPFFLTGLRISGGLALIGAVGAEFVAGTGGTATGLAYRILEAGYRLEIPRLFACLALLSVTGIAIYAALAGLTAWLAPGPRRQPPGRAHARS